MDELAKSLPEIIKQSATSPLGILALMIVGLAILAFFFFRGASERARLVIFIMLFFGVAAFSAVVMQQAARTRRSQDPNATNPPPSQEDKKPLALRASIWKVEFDSKGTLLATKEFSAGSGRASQTSLGEFAKWVSSELELTARREAPKVHLKVQIPADLKSEKPVVERIPKGQMDVLLWDERGTAKGRLPLTWDGLKDMQTPFQVEVRIPGAGSTVFQATPGTSLTKELDLGGDPVPVRIGVEKFAGVDDGITERVCNELSANPLIKIVDPTMLETIRKQIEQHKETMRLHPMMQTGVRSLGIDYIISGSVQAQVP